VPENPFNICPGGVTAGDKFVPFRSYYLCMELITEAKQLETGSSLANSTSVTIFCAAPVWLLIPLLLCRRNEHHGNKYCPPRD
jgi:hypothetical protein